MPAQGRSPNKPPQNSDLPMHAKPPTTPENIGSGALKDFATPTDTTLRLAEHISHSGRRSAFWRSGRILFRD